MSYEIVKSIKFKDGKVFVTGASNNVYPRTPHEWECSTITKILQEQGKEAADIEILKAYESGDFQSSSGKYARALQVLRHMPEYLPFSWHDSWEEYEKNRKERVDEWDGILIRALTTPLPREKYAITKQYGAGTVYMKYRKGAGHCKWAYYPTKATIFHWKEEAESIKKFFTNSDSWEIVQV